jgi:hypothetical protein
MPSLKPLIAVRLEQPLFDRVVEVALYWGPANRLPILPMQ